MFPRLLGVPWRAGNLDARGDWVQAEALLTVGAGGW